MNQILRMIFRVFLMQLMRRGTGRLIDSAINSASRRSRQARPQKHEQDIWQDDNQHYLEDDHDDNFQGNNANIDPMRNDRRAKMRRFR